MAKRKKESQERSGGGGGIKRGIMHKKTVQRAHEATRGSVLQGNKYTIPHRE
jgi:hypothetical protein